MSENEGAQATTTTPPAEGSEPPPAGDEAKQFDAEYVKKLRDEAAKYRTEAKANAGAAKRLAEIEEAQKSEADKAADRVKQLETEVQNAQREALRFKVASKHQITDEDAELFLTGADEETLTKQAERLTQRGEERKKQGNVVPKEGTTPNAAANDERTTVRNLFGSG